MLNQEIVRGDMVTVNTPAMTEHVRGRFDQVKYNLMSKTRLEWLLFFVVVPAIFYLMYRVPQGIKESYLILNVQNLFGIQTYFLSSYTHTDLLHLVGNLVVYMVTMFALFALESNMRRFWVVTTGAFIGIPIVTSLLTVGLWRVTGMTVSQTQGSSSIGAALFAYALISLVLVILGDAIEVIDHPEQTKSKGLFYISCGMLTFILMMVVIAGLNLGMYVNTGIAMTNGLAHFGGFMTGLIIFLVYDVITSHRTYFHIIAGSVVAIGIIWYSMYLTMLLNVLKG